MSKEVVEYGLQHTNGYVFWCVSRDQAEGLKAGDIIMGRRGDWANHTLVRRTITTIWGEPEPISPETA